MTIVFARRCEVCDKGLSPKEARVKHSLAARALLFDAVKREYHLDASAFAEKRTANGKPYLEGAPFSFNLSHSGDFVVCALSDTPVGVDIERIAPIEPRVLRRFCPDAPCATVREQVRAWTRYESRGKLVGHGIPYPTAIDTVCFFREYTDIEGYLVTVCSEKDDFSDSVIIE